jgi:putative tricarboxylic transport membrane protein
MMIGDGNPLMFVQRPVSLALVITIAVLLLLLVLPAFRKKRDQFSD